MWALILKEFRQVRRDHRTLAMMIALPVMMLIVFGYAASFDVDEVSAVVIGPGADAAAQRLPDAFDVIGTHVIGGRERAVQALRDGEAVAAFVTGADPQVLIDGSELFAARRAMQVLSAAAAGPGPGDPVSGVAAGAAPEVLFNPELKTSVIMIPAIAGMILVFIGVMITSLGVVRERQAGTLEQLAVMPFSPTDVFVGKIAPYFLVASVDLAVVLAVGVWLFDVPFNGSVLVLGLGALLFLFVTLGLGVLISTVSANQGQAIQLSLMVLIPQVLLSGMIFPIESMAAGIRWISYLLPLRYFIEISRPVMIRGAGLAAVWQPMALLADMGLVIFGLSIIRFRRDLAPSGRARRRTRLPAAGQES
ncbi:MAG: ABC transporter permease [Actinomycetota bacterium]